MDARAINAKLAEHLFEWQKRDHPQGGKYWVDGAGWPMAWTEDVPDWSTTWEGMGLVVEAMRERGWERGELCWSPPRSVVDDKYQCIFSDGTKYGLLCLAYADSAPMAVALAALKALGVEVGER